MNKTTQNATVGVKEGASRVRGGGMGDGRGRTFVAVYGTLMRGERNERWRDGVATVSEGVMQGLLYDTGWGFPNFVPQAECAGVRCEVLETDDEGIAHMDVLEGYPHLYVRAPVRVKCDDGETREALVYTMLDERRSPDERRIMPNAAEIADWREYRKGNLRLRR